VRVEAEGAGRVVPTKVDDIVDRCSGSPATDGEPGKDVRALGEEW